MYITTYTHSVILHHYISKITTFRGKSLCIVEHFYSAFSFTTWRCLHFCSGPFRFSLSFSGEANWVDVCNDSFVYMKIIPKPHFMALYAYRYKNIAFFALHSAVCHACMVKGFRISHSEKREATLPVEDYPCTVCIWRKSSMWDMCTLQGQPMRLC